MYKWFLSTLNLRHLTMDDKDVYGVFCMCFFQVIMENMLRILLVVSQLSSFPVHGWKWEQMATQLNFVQKTSWQILSDHGYQRFPKVPFNIFPFTLLFFPFSSLPFLYSCTSITSVLSHFPLYFFFFTYVISFLFKYSILNIKGTLLVNGVCVCMKIFQKVCQIYV